MGVKWHTHIADMDQDPATGPQGNRGLRVPNITNANQPTAASTNNGLIAYDTTNNQLEAVINGSWATIQTSAASAASLDDGYNNGSTITVDTGDVALNLSATLNLIVNAASAGTTAVGIEINDNTTGTFTDGLLFTAANSIVDAIDASAANITNALNAGANNITATNWNIAGSTGTVNAQALDRATAGALNIGGTTATSVAITPNTTVAGTFGVTGATTLSAALTQSGGNVSSTVSATTGDGFLIDGSTVTTGNVLRIEYDAANSGAGFGAIEVTEDAVAVFTVAEDGNTTIAGTATGTAALTLTAGDLTITDGGLNVTQTSGDAIDLVPPAAGAAVDLNLPASYNLAGGAIDIDGSTGSGPVIAVNMSSTYTGDYIALNLTNAVGAIGLNMTGAGTRTVSMFSVTDTPSTTATFDLNVTPAGAQAGANVFDIDIAGTGSANVIDIDFAGAYTGDALSIDMTNAVAASAFDITGAGTRTTPLIAITDVPTTSAPSIDLNITPAASVQAGIDIDVAGTSGADILAIDFSAAHTGDAVNITMTNAGAGAQAIVVDGSLAASGAIVSLSTSGILTAAGSVLTAACSGQPGAANTGTCGRFLDTGAAQATTYAVQIDSTNNEALTVTTGRAHFVESISSLASNACGIADNYVQAAGSANAITVAAITDAAGVTIPLTDGLKLVIDLNSRTLQAGANTLNYAGGGNVSITRGTDPTANLSTAYAANGVIEVVYSSGATAWLCVSQ